MSIDWCEVETARIARLQRQVGPDGVCPLPFVCWGCDEARTDFCMITGDRVPLCQRCFNGFAGSAGQGG